MKIRKKLSGKSKKFTKKKNSQKEKNFLAKFEKNFSEK